MSRCTIRFACAWATAARTSRKTRRRASTSSPSRRSSGRSARRRRAPAPGTAAPPPTRRVGQTSDVRMLESSQDAPLPPESLLPRAPDQARVEELDGRLPLEAAVAAPGQPHAAHAPLADRRDEHVGADPLPGERCRRRHPQNRAFKKTLPVRERRSSSSASRSAASAVPQRAATPARPALAVRHLHRAVQIGADDLPAFAVTADMTSAPGHLSSGLCFQGGPPAAARGGDRCALFPAPLHCALRHAAHDGISAKEKPQKNLRSTTCASGASTAARASTAALIPSSSFSSAAASVRASRDVISNPPPRFSALACAHSR